DRSNDGWRGADCARFTNALNTHWIHRRGGLSSIELHPRHHGCLGNRVVHQRSGDKLTLFIVDSFFIQRLSDRLDDAAMHLAVNQHRIQNLPTIVYSDVSLKFDLAGIAVYFDLDDMCAEWEREVRRLKEVGCW